MFAEREEQAVVVLQVVDLDLHRQPGTGRLCEVFTDAQSQREGAIGLQWCGQDAMEPVVGVFSGRPASIDGEHQSGVGLAECVGVSDVVEHRGHPRPGSFAVVPGVGEPVEQVDSVGSLVPVGQCGSGGEGSWDGRVAAGPAIQAGVDWHASRCGQGLELGNLDFDRAAAQDQVVDQAVLDPASDIEAVAPAARQALVNPNRQADRTASLASGLVENLSNPP